MKLRLFCLLPLSVLVFTGCSLLQFPSKGEPFQYLVDPAIVPTQTELPGLDGGAPRSVGVVVGPDGSRDEFVVDEVIYRPRNDDELNEFLSKYGGTVIRDGTPLLLPEVAAENPTPESSGWYLIRVDLQKSVLDDISTNMERGGSHGLHLFSSDDATRLGALLAREKVGVHRQIGPNFLVVPQAVEEHPDGSGGFLDAETFAWMTEDDDANIPGNQGLSVGVVRAWRYLSYQGVPSQGVQEPPIVAIIETGGFDLDANGNSLSAAPDFFPSRPLQIDLVDYDLSVGGINLFLCSGSPCPWHGQQVAGVATARHSNRFGGAGIGSNFARPLLIKIDGSFFTMAGAIRSAYLNGANVINLSLAGGCDVWSWICAIPPNDIYARMKNEVLLATTGGTAVIAAAGNDIKDLSTDDVIPCETQSVICVGAIDQNANNVFNYGASVDIWAPQNIASTVTPPRMGQTGMSAICCFGGTSAASPFVAGVVALMKALNPGLSVAQIKTILQQTANASPDPRVDEGYVDAFRAVQAVAPNQPPTVSFTIPSAGASVSHNREVYLHADVSDPETGMEFRGEVVFSSNTDGVLCSTTGFVTGCRGPALSIGPHELTATATDPFGSSATTSISVNSINQTPIARITFPEDGSSFFADQTINLRGYGFDWDEQISPANTAWDSNLDGSIATGQDVFVSLTSGIHTVTLTATDSQGLTGQDTTMLDVQPASGHPSALIVNLENTDPNNTTVITFEGQGTDPEDGVLTGPRLSWSSDIDGLLGTGTTLVATLSGPPASSCEVFVVHTITLTVTDSDGNQATHSRNLRFGRIC